jgi:Ca2+-transporting ATPase
MFLMLVGPFVGMPLPLLPLQILWVNLITDGLPGLALAEEPGERGIMKRAPYHPKESIFSQGLGTQIIWIGLLLGVASLVVGYFSWLGDNQGSWQTMIFTTLVFSQMGNALAVRSNQNLLFQIGLFSNRLMVGAVILGFVLQLVLIYVPIFQTMFSTQALSPQELLVCLLASLTVFLVIELVKWVRSRRSAEL